ILDDVSDNADDLEGSGVLTEAEMPSDHGLAAAVHVGEAPVHHGRSRRVEAESQLRTPTARQERNLERLQIAGAYCALADADGSAFLGTRDTFHDDLNSQRGAPGRQQIG